MAALLAALLAATGCTSIAPRLGGTYGTTGASIPYSGDFGSGTSLMSNLPSPAGARSAKARRPEGAPVTTLPTIAAESSQRPENLGPNINTAKTELGPVIAPDGNTLYFTRGGSDGNQDIWFSTQKVDGTWATARMMPPPLVNVFNNFVESVTPDGNTLLLGGSYAGERGVVSGLSLSHRTSTGWSAPEKVKVDNFSKNRSTSNFLCSDGMTLIMSLERDGGIGKQDLYVSFLGGDGSWSSPADLGSTVNTSEIEFAPFLAADGRTLYFSSKGHGGFGDADIFFSRRLDDSWTNWSKPENLGRTINSAVWDAYYVIPASGEYVYFGSSSNSYGQSDLVRVGLPERARPAPVVLISGTVNEAGSDRPVDAKIYYQTLPDGKEAGVARTDPATGEYKIALPSGASYAFHAEAPGFVGVNDNIDLTAQKEYAEMERDLTLIPIEIGRTVMMNNLFFDFAKSNLRPESFPELNRLVKLMRDVPSLALELAGHTDNVGNEHNNESLAEARAGAVAKYLIEHGINTERLTWKSYGKVKPVASNATGEGRQQNRRVEFTIVRR